MRDYSYEASKGDTTSPPMHRREHDTCTMKILILRVGDVEWERSIGGQARCMSACFDGSCGISGCLYGKEREQGEGRLSREEENMVEVKRESGKDSKVLGHGVASERGGYEPGSPPDDEHISRTRHNRNHVRLASVDLAARQQQPEQNQRVSESTTPLLRLSSVWRESRRILRHTG